MEEQQVGLVSREGVIPLVGVAITGRIGGVSSAVTVRQRYVNREAVDVEAVYLFPLEEGAAVCGFSARVGERLIEGRIEEKEQAFALYDEALSQGHGAYLLEQQRPNIFTASVGNLRPGETVEITVRYVAELNYQGSAIRFQLPTTVAPRYSSPSNTDPRLVEEAFLEPQRVGSVPYGLNLTLTIEADSVIKTIESPSHPLQVVKDGAQATVTLSHADVALDRDVVVLIEASEPHQASVRVASEEDGLRVLMVNLWPDLEGLPIPPQEISFLLDCSGSMGGESITSAKRALALCVRALSEGDTFNIMCFGSQYRQLWSEPQPFTDQTLAQATQYIEATQADMGGTEILPALQVLLTNPLAAKQARQILLLTDGEVSNEDQVIALCREHAREARVFTFGIGASVSSHLVRGVARASGGTAAFIYPGERIEPIVLRMFNRLHTPLLEDVALDWGGMKVEVSPRELPALLNGERFTVYGRLQSGSSDSVVLRASDREWRVPLDLERAERGGAVPVLWARALIRELEAQYEQPPGSQRRSEEKKQTIQQEIVDLSKRYGLTSRFTSFVAIETRSSAERTQEPAEMRRIPLAMPTDAAARSNRASQPAAGAYSISAPTPAPVSQGMFGAIGGGIPGPFINYSKMPAPAAPPPGMGGGIGGAVPSMGPPMGPPMNQPLPMGGFPGLGQPQAPPPPPAPAAAPSMAPPTPKPVVVSKDAKSKPAPLPMGLKKEKAKADMPDRAERTVFRSKGGPGGQSASPPPAEELEYERSIAFESGHLDDDIVEFIRSATGEDLETPPPDLLFSLLMTQRADGSFPLSDLLRFWLKDRWLQVKQACQQYDEALVATTLMVSLLPLKALERQEEWQPALQKAQRWLKRQTTTFDPLPFLS